jgi:hypothetical protein
LPQAHQNLQDICQNNNKRKMWSIHFMFVNVVFFEF